MSKSQSVYEFITNASNPLIKQIYLGCYIIANVNGHVFSAMAQVTSWRGVVTSEGFIKWCNIVKFDSSREKKLKVEAE